MSDVQDLMLARFLTLYGEPKTDNLEAFFDEYERALKGTAREILQLAADRVIKDQEFRSWPTPGECVKAVHVEAERKAIERERFAKPDLDKADRTWPAPTEESKARVRELIANMKRGISVSGPEPGGTLTEKSKRMTGEA
jgi:hypothetical protein